MSATATEPSGQRKPLASLLLPLTLIASGALFGCAEEPLPPPKVSREDCLRGVEMNQLKSAIARCDAVVAAFPKDPLPLNERFLLHTLNQDTRSACRDIVRANALAKGLPRGEVDELLRQDLKLRLASCLPRPGAAQQPSSH